MITPHTRISPLIAALSSALLIHAHSPTRAHSQPQSTPPEFQTICSDAGAGGYESFPDICRLQDGRLMLVFYAGYNHVALPNESFPQGGRVVAMYSSNEGKSWTAPVTVVDTPVDDRDPSITQFKDGRLACTFFTYPKLHTQVVYSHDAGKSWTAPQEIAAHVAVSSPIRILGSGRWVLGVYDQDDENKKARGGVSVSDDQGKTWSKVHWIDSHGAFLAAETDTIELQDGLLFAALRGERGSPMHFSTSKDHGITWSPAAPSGFEAHCPYLHRLPDGTIALAVREFGPGPWKGATTLRFSPDDARTWTKPVLVDRAGGSYPSLVNLKDGSTLIVYYTDLPERANIRSRKFQLKASGTDVDWIQ